MQDETVTFVHGWGFHSGLWDSICEELPGYQCQRIDLGFLSGGGSDIEQIPANTICVGHSLGVLWLLKNARRPLRALVSICGFDCFYSHTDKRILRRMALGLKRNPLRQMQAFWQSCAVDDFARQADLNSSALANGLQWLQGWDGRHELQFLDCPVLALASRDDHIVTESMSKNIWNNDQLIWSETGGHGLPLTRPDWCARNLRRFIHALTP